MDSRGHGRSTRDARPYGYDLMADDVVGLLDYLNIKRAAVVGWSDGGILGLDLAIRYPKRVAKVFAFAANTDPSGVVDGVEKNPTFAAFIKRAGLEYQALSPTPGGLQGLRGRDQRHVGEPAELVGGSAQGDQATGAGGGRRP